LAVVTAIALFGFQSGAALSTVVGVLVEVPVMLSVVHLVRRSRGWYERAAPAATLQQLDQIFSSTRQGSGSRSIDTWGGVGMTGEWATKPISIYGRNSLSGTYEFFKKTVLYNGDYKEAVKQQRSFRTLRTTNSQSAIPASATRRTASALSPWLHFMAHNATIRPLKRPIPANTRSPATCTFI
jgi:hypothetical protein